MRRGGSGARGGEVESEERSQVIADGDEEL